MNINDIIKNCIQAKNWHWLYVYTLDECGIDSHEHQTARFLIHNHTIRYKGAFKPRHIRKTYSSIYHKALHFKLYNSCSSCLSLEINKKDYDFSFLCQFINARHYGHYVHFHDCNNLDYETAIIEKNKHYYFASDDLDFANYNRWIDLYGNDKDKLTFEFLKTNKIKFASRTPLRIKFEGDFVGHRGELLGQMHCPACRNFSIFFGHIETSETRFIEQFYDHSLDILYKYLTARHNHDLYLDYAAYARLYSK